MGRRSKLSAAQKFLRAQPQVASLDIADDDLRPEYDFSGGVRGKYVYDPPSPARRPYAPRVPPLSDPSWPERSRPMLNYLSTPRTVEEIWAWGKGRKMPIDMIVNCLAYLEDRGLVVSRMLEGVSTWRRTAWKEK